jgi:hypothetical protein
MRFIQRAYARFWARRWEARSRKWWRLHQQAPGFRSDVGTAAEHARNAEAHALAWRMKERA